MPDQSAREKLDAAQAYFEAKERGDHLAMEAALTIYVGAERTHNRRLEGLWLPLAGVVVTFLLVVVLIFSIVGTVRANKTADKSNETSLAVARTQHQVITLQGELRHAAILTCERGNETRLVNIGNLEDDITTYEEIALETGVDLDDAIARKQQTIHDTIAAQASVAAEPGSAEVDCQAASLAAFRP